MFSGSNIGIHGGTFNHTIINQTNGTSRGMDILLGWVATGAFHNSDELYDSPKCHPQTRVAVLADIMEWVSESESSARDDFMLWLFGPAGAGKSAIAKRIAEIASDMGMLIATFFFSGTSPDRSNKDRLVATLAYQLALSIPDTRSYIENAIEQDPTIFRKNVQTQIDTLLIKPFQSISSTQIVPSKKLIIVDGLDECNDSKSQVAILEAISHSFTRHKLSIVFIVVSRPEPDLVTSFNCNEPLKSIHRRLALDDAYRPDDDIHLFFSEKFEHIKCAHLMRSTIPISWPTHEILDTLVTKSSGQFIYASTVVKFVESSCHRPSSRLNIILGISPPGRTNPFAELDALYNHILSSVEDVWLTLRVLSLYVMTPDFVYGLCNSMSPELFLSLEPGDIQLALINLSSIVTCESSGEIKILHASLADFLSDKHRSTAFYIDKASTCIDFVRRVLRYVKGPDGIIAGDIDLFREVLDLSPWMPKDQLWSDIFNFDLDAFVDASIRWQQFSGHTTLDTFSIWMRLLNDVGLEDSRDRKEALYRLKKCFDSRLQIYQSDWRLQLLATLAVTHVMYHGPYGIQTCRSVDIILEMDDHDIHFVDQNALDLRHAYLQPWLGLVEIMPQVDDDAYASAALHCMRFLSNPPKYSEKNERPEMGLIYAEWKTTCAMTLDMLCRLLQRANASPELVQFIGNHDINPAVQKDLSANRVSEANAHILAFLSRGSVCENWRIISAIQLRSLSKTRQPSEFAISVNEYEEIQAGWHFTRQRLDQCCLHIH